MLRGLFRFAKAYEYVPTHTYTYCPKYYGLTEFQCLVNRDWYHSKTH